MYQTPAQMIRQLSMKLIGACIRAIEARRVALVAARQRRYVARSLTTRTRGRGTWSARRTVA